MSVTTAPALVCVQTEAQVDGQIAKLTGQVRDRNKFVFHSNAASVELKDLSETSVTKEPNAHGSGIEKATVFAVLALQYQN